MKFIFNFPDLGEGLEEGTVLEWYVKEGQEVKVGDSLVQMETDKVVADIPSPKDGVILKTHGEVGDIIKVGSPLVDIQVEGSEANAENSDSKDVVESEEERIEKDVDSGQVEKTVIEPITESDEDAGAVVGTMEVAAKNAIMPESNEAEEYSTDTSEAPRKALATPVARAMAKNLGIDINKVEGSGPSGRVKKSDIREFKANAEQGYISTPNIRIDDNKGDETYVPLTQIRKAIAKNMLQSIHNTAQMSVFEEVDIYELMQVRGRYKQRFANKDVNLTYLAFIVKAVAQALKHHRQLNSQIDTENNRMIYRNRYHIGVAVDTPDGLMVPVIRDADKLTIFQIAKQIAELANKARNRKLSLDEMRGGSFSITSFGSIGGIYATPVLNYPQAGILGIGRILKKPVVRDEEIVVGHVMPLSLTVDHRIVDGGEATRFIYKVMEYLADPISFLMEEE